jgi:hypothetical protein
MNTISKQPPTTRQFFLVTVVLSAISFIPLIGWFSAFFLVLWLISWMLLDTRGFFSVVWRILLGAVLLLSAGVLYDVLCVQPLLEYRMQWLMAGTIGFALSAFGLVRSIFKPQTE